MSDYILNTPVIFIIFNRPDCVRESFESIRNAKPNKLYIVADGPREDHPDDKELCFECRNIVSEIDWNCEVTRIYSDINLGCGRRPASGISEVFKKEESAIIIEDDCVPTIDFYRFCQEMLCKYKDDKRVFSVSGMSFGLQDENADYYFTYINNTWGWATWKRVWDNYDYDLKKYPKVVDSDYFYKLFNDRDIANFWNKWFDECYSNSLTSSWDHQFLFESFMDKGLHVYPNKNLVKYLGFNNDATHCTSVEADSRLAVTTSRVETMNFPVVHPSEIRRNELLERIQMKDLFFINHINNQFKKFIKYNLKVLKKSKRIVIYGAGNWGKQLGLELLEQGIKNFEYVVSKKQSRDTVFGKGLYELNQYIEQDGDYIIVAVTDTYRDEMETLLRSLDIKNYVFLKSDAELIKEKYAKQPVDAKKILLITSVDYAGHGKNIVKELFKIRQDVSVGWYEKSPTEMSIPNVEKVSIDNVEKYYEYFYGAKYILTDTGCSVQRKEQVKIQLKHWSSITLKMFGYDELSYRNEKDIDKFGVHGWDGIDYLLVGSKFDERTCRSGFKYDGPAIYVGSPRSDILFDKNYNYDELRAAYGLSKNAKYLLYAPTFRMKDTESTESVFEDEMDYYCLKNALEEKFSGDWNILLRLHPFAADITNIDRPEFVINVTDYVDGEELVGISDALITDYSSIMFEPAFVNKPVFLFAPDLKEYTSKERGFYINYNELPFSIAESTKQLSDNISNFDSNKYNNKLKKFFDSYDVHEDGKASLRAAEFINSLISK